MKDDWGIVALVGLAFFFLSRKKEEEKLPIPRKKEELPVPPPGEHKFGNLKVESYR